MCILCITFFVKASTCPCLFGLLTLQQGKRLWIKDMAYYLFPPNEKPASIAPSLPRLKRGVGTPGSSSTGTDSAQTAPYPYHTEPEPGNPTVLPDQVLREFHFTFLIRHPRSSIPSYYRCTVPPLDEVTGWYEFLPLEAGYRELRRLFDYLQSTSQIGPTVSGRHDASQLPNGLRGIGDGEGDRDIVEICVVDADDLLDNPSGILEAFCKSVGLEYDSKMLDWSTEEDHQQAKAAFEKWKGWHDDALESSSLKPRAHVSRVPDLRISLFECADCLIDKKKKIKSVEEEDHEWTLKFGEKGAKVIRETVNANIGDYEYLKQFAVKA